MVGPHVGPVGRIVESLLSAIALRGGVVGRTEWQWHLLTLLAVRGDAEGW